MVVAVGCTVLQMWRDGVLWALQVRVLRAPAVIGHVAILDPPLDKVLACALRRSEGRVEVLDPSRGGGPGLRLLVLGVPLRGARGDTGPLREQEAGPGPYV